MRRLCASLTMAGLVISGYLLLRTFAVASGEKPGSGVCSLLFALDCDAALASRAAHHFGLPLAGWGVVHFGTLAALLVVAASSDDEIRASAFRAGVVLALAASAVGAALLAQMIAGAAPFCPLCAAVHAIDFALVPLFLHAGGGPIARFPRHVLAAASSLAGSSAGPASPRPAPFVAVALVALVLWQAMYALTLRHKPEDDPRFDLAAYALSRRMDVPVDARDPRIGPSDAPVRIVVFSDFECPVCRDFAKRLAALVDRRRGKVCAVFKHFPAGVECNPLLTRELHPHACAAARAAVAAADEGKFREFHDAAFAFAGELEDDALRAVARDVGIDADRFERGRGSDAARGKVADDVALGVRLGVHETPAVFVDGRRVRDLRPKTLDLVLMSRLAEVPVAVEARASAPAASPAPATSSAR